MAPAPASSRSFWILARRSILLWVGTLFSIVGTIFLTVGVQDALTEHTYRTQGLTVEATVLDKSIERAKRGENSRTRYLVTYRFTSSEGHEIENSAEVSVDEWERLEAGQRVLVTYLPTAPDSNRPEAEADWIGIYIFSGLGGLFTLLGCGLAFHDLRAIARTIRLSKQGLRADGTIVSVGPTATSINRVTQWRLSYSYRDHLGREQTGESHLLSPEEAAAWSKGAHGEVRFDRQRPNVSVWIGNHDQTSE